MKLKLLQSARDAMRCALRSYALFLYELGLLLALGSWGFGGLLFWCVLNLDMLYAFLNHHLFPMPFSWVSDSCILGCLLNWGLKSKQVVRTYLVILRTPSLRPFGLRGGQAQCGERPSTYSRPPLCRCRLLRQFASALGCLCGSWAGSSNCDLPPRGWVTGPRNWLGRPP